MEREVSELPLECSLFLLYRGISRGMLYSMDSLSWLEKAYCEERKVDRENMQVICTTGCLLPTLYREWKDYRRSALGIDPEEMEEEDAERQGLLDNQSASHQVM